MRTLNRWLRKRDRAISIAGLQAQVDTFVRCYNEKRPHSARGMNWDPPVGVDDRHRGGVTESTALLWASTASDAVMRSPME
ncbi:MAG: integrase core domain-containing protein [Acidimicrobiales bacterium]